MYAIADLFFGNFPGIMDITGLRPESCVSFAVPGGLGWCFFFVFKGISARVIWGVGKGGRRCDISENLPKPSLIGSWPLQNLPSQMWSSINLFGPTFKSCICSCFLWERKFFDFSESGEPYVDCGPLWEPKGFGPAWQWANMSKYGHIKSWIFSGCRHSLLFWLHSSHSSHKYLRLKIEVSSSSIFSLGVKISEHLDTQDDVLSIFLSISSFCVNHF